MTGEELLAHPEFEPCELVAGRVVPMSPTGFVHGVLEARLAALLQAWNSSARLGQVVAGEVGIYTGRDPDTVRAADLAFVSHQRIRGWSGTGFLDVPPELVVEILSPDDRASELAEKLAEYFAAGVARVWVVDPRLRSVLAYRSATEASRFAEGDLLREPDLLPGFDLPLAELFAP